MRIITGSARGVRLETLEGNETRPTTEFVKEAVFSMIQFDLEERRVLDLFAGSGQMGLEALSRGAATATLVDRNPAAVNVIKRNAQKCRLYDRCRVLGSEWESFVRGNAGRERFDVIFLDPPYADNSIGRILRRLCEADMIADNGLIVCESDSEEEFCAEGLRVLRHKKYGRIYITLLTKEAAL